MTILDNLNIYIRSRHEINDGDIRGRVPIWDEQGICRPDPVQEQPRQNVVYRANRKSTKACKSPCWPRHEGEVGLELSRDCANGPVRESQPEQHRNHLSKMLGKALVLIEMTMSKGQEQSPIPPPKKRMSQKSLLTNGFSLARQVFSGRAEMEIS